MSFFLPFDVVMEAFRRGLCIWTPESFAVPIGTRAHAIVAVTVAIVTLGTIHLEGVFRTGSDVPAAVLRKVTVMGSWSAHTPWWFELAVFTALSVSTL